MIRPVVAVLAGLLLVAAPATASEGAHGEAWSDLSGGGLLAQSCPSTGSAGEAAYEIAGGVLRVLDDRGAVVADHALPGSGAWEVASRYDLDSRPDGDRGVDVVLVTDGGVPRLEVLVDAATSVPIAMTSFAGDGSVHCAFTLLGWDGRPVAVPDPEDLVSDRVPMVIDDFVLGGIVLGDGFVAGRYSDGVFTFSLTQWDAVFAVEGAVGDPVGRTEVAPGRGLVSWPSADGTLVLIGDLPDDVLERVVSALPEPDSPGFLGRLWRRLFG